LRLAWFSDLHVGSTVGLWPGKHRIEGGGTYEANAYQKWLYECWQDAVAEIQSLDGPVIGVLNGDVIQGVNMRDGQLITNKIDIQVQAAQKLLAPLIERFDKFYMIRGTEWHEGKASEHVEILGQLLGAEPDPASGQYSRWEMYLEVAPDVVIHTAHHIGTSSVPWYEATVPLRELLMQLAELSRFFVDKAPQVKLVMRSHRHRGIGVWAPPDIQVYVTPAWQLKTAFAHKRATATLPQIGYMLVEWDGTDLTVKPRVYPLPPPDIERLPTEIVRLSDAA